MSQTPALSLSITREPPSLADFDVKQCEQRRFLDTDVTFTVIGSSHAIAVPALDYYELFSCKDVTGECIEEVPLREGYTSRVSHETDAFTVSSHIAVQPLSTFPDPECFDIAYRFGPAAYTTIDRITETAYETYHTYPEYDIAVRTENTFADCTLASAPVRGSPTVTDSDGPSPPDFHGAGADPTQPCAAGDDDR